MTYTSVNGLQLYYETRGSGRPLVLLHGGLLTIDLNFGPLLEPLAASRQVIAVELQGHGHTADTDRPMTIEALAGDVVALLDYLGVAEADLFGSRPSTPGPTTPTPAPPSFAKRSSTGSSPTTPT
jgi:pimeloyl-ACP methyl ester carboxylesterase